MESHTPNNQEEHNESCKMEHEAGLHSLNDFCVNKFDKNTIPTKRRYAYLVKGVLGHQRVSEKRFSKCKPEEVEKILFTGLRKLRAIRTPNTLASIKNAIWNYLNYVRRKNGSPIFTTTERRRLERKYKLYK